MLLRCRPRIAVLGVEVGEVVNHVDEVVLVQLGDLSVVFLYGGVELADVLTRGARCDEVPVLKSAGMLKACTVDDAFEAKEKASPGAFDELEVLGGEDNGAQRVDVRCLLSLGVVAKERLDEVREEVALCVKQPVGSLHADCFSMGVSISVAHLLP
eukprot:3291937-Rhodomonas_salina.1